jgi:hypothetical protein
MSVSKGQECRERAQLCRFNADNTGNAFDEAEWQDLADDWTNLAEAFERLDGPKWKH